MGADAASCTGLLVLHGLNASNSPDVAELRARFEREKKVPGSEPLSGTIDYILEANLKRAGR